MNSMDIDKKDTSPIPTPFVCPVQLKLTRAVSSKAVVPLYVVDAVFPEVIRSLSRENPP
jgi:hypothetical protein